MIHVLIGTRAQLIKMIPIMHEMQLRKIEYNFIFMAQHTTTIREIINQFGLKKPDYVIGERDKDIVNTKDMIIWSLKVLIEGVINRNKIFKNDHDGVVLIHGDAPPLLLGGLIAKAQKLKVASVEAGLRSFNYFKPFPEEITRVIAAKMGLIDIFFCQNSEAMANVAQYKGDKVNTHGNTIYDTLNLASAILTLPKRPLTQNYSLVTLHRFETISKLANLNAVVDLLLEISKYIHLIFILHPPTQAALNKYCLYNKLYDCNNITLLPRLDFLEFNKYILNAEFIISDGGSNQEESAYLGIPCLLFRNETERSEGLKKNVVLSKFDEPIIMKFIKNYKDYKIKTVLDGVTPTEYIINNVLKYKK